MAPRANVARALLAALALTAQAAGAAEDFSAIAPRVMASVVQVVVAERKPVRQEGEAADAKEVPPAQPPRRPSGSGLILDAEGHVLTVAHLLRPGDRVVVHLEDGAQRPARIVGRDRRSNVALLKVEAAGLPPATIGDPHKLRVAERIYAVGKFGGSSPTVTDGIVSSLSLRRGDLTSYIQTTALLTPVMDGGPLFNRDGEVVGINNVLVVRSTGAPTPISFAIPIDSAIQVAAELRANGRVQRGALGWVIQDVPADVAQALGLPAGIGAHVRSVFPGATAERAGVAAGDVVLRINGEEIRNSREAARLVVSLKPGSRVRLELRRRGSAEARTVEAPVADAGD